MPAATVTIRELKNKDTGIDLTVTKVKEVKAMLGSTYEYDITVVSNLSYFKAAKHKETDNVQFVIAKKFGEFEDLHSKLNAKFSGTALPMLPKKVLMVSDTVARERRNGLDNFVRFLAMTPKLCTSSLVLEFLGVNPLKAGKFRTMEVTESKVDKSENDETSSSPGETETTEETDDDKVPPPDLFDDGDEDEDDEDLFGADPGVSATAVTDDAKLFDDPDLGGGFEEGEGEDLFLVDTDPEPKKQAVDQSGLSDEEDNTDLFKIDDDIDQIMKWKLKPDKKEEGTKSEGGDTSPTSITSPEETVISPSESVGSPELTVAFPERPKPVPRTKPTVSKKFTHTEKEEGFSAETEMKGSQSETQTPRPTPAPRSKPPIKQKPAIGQKPSVPNKKPSAPNEKFSVPNENPSVPNDKSKVKYEKPNIPPRKPIVKAKPTVSAAEPVGMETKIEKSNTTESLGEDDILNYIKENTSENNDDLDLFS